MNKKEKESAVTCFFSKKIVNFFIFFLYNDILLFSPFSFSYRMCMCRYAASCCLLFFLHFFVSLVVGTVVVFSSFSKKGGAQRLPEKKQEKQPINFHRFFVVSHQQRNQRREKSSRFSAQQGRFVWCFVFCWCFGFVLKKMKETGCGPELSVFFFFYIGSEGRVATKASVAASSSSISGPAGAFTTLLPAGCTTT